MYVVEDLPINSHCVAVDGVCEQSLKLVAKKKKKVIRVVFFKQRKPCGWTLCSLYSMANMESAVEPAAAGTS